MSSEQPADHRLRVVIVRDRPTAGGGIVNYYAAVSPHLNADVAYSDVGRPYSCYQGTAGALLRVNLLRLLWDWMSLAYTIIRHRPDIVHVNPGMDPTTCRSLKRDAVNILIARMFRRRTLVFWRGWESDCSRSPEFPTGNDSILHRIYKMAAAHIVLAYRFKTDL